MESTSEMLTNEQAQSEANLILEDKAHGFSNMIVKHNVNPKFQGEMLENARTDIAAQHIDSIKKNHPDVYQLLVKQNDAIKNISAHFVDEAEFNRMDSEGKIKKWKEAEDKTMNTLRYIQVTYMEKDKKTKPRSKIGILAESIAEAEDAHILQPFRDEIVYGDIITAIVSGREAERLQRIHNPEFKIDVESSYGRQQRYNTVFEENKHKAIPPQPLS